MGCCSSKPTSDSPPTDPSCPPQPQPNIPLSVSPQRPDGTPQIPKRFETASPSIAASTPPEPHRLERSNPSSVRDLHGSPLAEAYMPSDSARIGRLPVSNGEASPEPLPRSDRPIISPLPQPLRRSNSARPSGDTARMAQNLHQPGRSKPSSPSSRMVRSVSAMPPSSSSAEHIAGGGDQIRGDRVPGPRVRQEPAAARGKNGEPLPSAVREVFPDGFRFRILVLGRSQSGKSSLINSIFGVDMAAPGSQPGNADINVLYPANNSYLVVHEYAGFESGDAQSLQTIRHFISNRTDASCAESERLHAIWICVSMPEVVDVGLWEGVEEILGMKKKVPVIIVFTKFDVFVSRVLFDLARGDIQYHGQALARALVNFEGLCNSLFHKKPDDVPAVTFSKKQGYDDYTNKLTATTHIWITASSYNLSTSQARQGRPPITPVALAWSIAQRANHDITIQASIETGRSRYWRDLGSSPDFTDRPLESCVNVIHADIIKVWNFDDREGYLICGDFTARMSHLQVVGGRAKSPVAPPDLYPNGAAIPMAPWVNGVYRNKTRDIRYIMAYIVDLTVILHGLFVSSHSVTSREVQSAVKHHAESKSRIRIHNEIHSFFTAKTPFIYDEMDTILEKIIDLIKQNCVQTSSQHSN